MSSAAVTWSKVRGSIDRGSILHAAFSGGPKGFAAEFEVTRVTREHAYLRQGHINCTLRWPKASNVKVIDSRTWIETIEGGTGHKAVWTIQPEAPF